MARDQRVEDNWALLFAQKLAIQNKVPLHVIFCLTENFMDATIRHFIFMLKGRILFMIKVHLELSIA